MGIPEGFRISSTEKKKFDLLPEDFYQVVIESITLKTDQSIYQSEEVEDKLGFVFRVIEEGMYKGRKLWYDARPIMSVAGVAPSSLYKIFCAVNQVQLTDEETKGISTRTINEMEGKQLRVVVKQKKNLKGELKNKISDYLPIKGKPIVLEDNSEDSSPNIPEPVEPPPLPADDTFKIEDGDLPF